MSIVSLDKNGKAVVSTNNGLDYMNKDGEQGIREVSTAITDVVREAHNLSKMDQGNVAVSIQDKDGNYSNYFVNETKDGDAIVLMPSAKDQAENGKEPIYFNKKYEKEDNGIVKRDKDTNEPLYYFTMNKDTPAAQELINNIKINEFERSDGSNGLSLATRVTLNNPELATKIAEYKNLENPSDTSKTVAIISKEGVRIATTNELSEQKKANEIMKQANKVQDTGMDR